jgi:uncharacterized repeat protein (TIGR03803 family)
MKLVVSVAIAGVCCVLTAGGASAQQFEIVAALELSPRKPVGRLAQAGDGLFFGVTELGGQHDLGTIFKVERQPGGTWVATTVYSFSRAIAAQPVGGLIRGRDGNLYGLTHSGGADNRGTIYRVTPAGEVTILYTLRNEDSADLGPVGRPVQAPNGDFWGATFGGLVFKVSESGQFTPVKELPVSSSPNAATNTCTERRQPAARPTRGGCTG